MCNLEYDRPNTISSFGDNNPYDIRSFSRTIKLNEGRVKWEIEENKVQAHLKKPPYLKIEK